MTDALIEILFFYLDYAGTFFTFIILLALLKTYLAAYSALAARRASC